MTLLLDTHTLFWWVIEEDKQPPLVFAALQDRRNDVFVSIASAWEMAIKVGIGKWPEAAGLVDKFDQEAAATGFRILPISLAHVRAAGLMQTPHRDPFDRLLAAQAAIEDLTFVTGDTKLGGLGAQVLW